jgi:hypothetical protein
MGVQSDTLALLGEAEWKLQAEQGIRWVRNNLGWSHVDLCRLLGVSKRAVIRMEERETSWPSQNQHAHGIMILLAASAIRPALVSNDEMRAFGARLREVCQCPGPLAALHMLLEDNKGLWS